MSVSPSMSATRCCELTASSFIESGARCGGVARSLAPHTSGIGPALCGWAVGSRRRLRLPYFGNLQHPLLEQGCPHLDVLAHVADDALPCEPEPFGSESVRLAPLN